MTEIEHSLCEAIEAFKETKTAVEENHFDHVEQKQLFYPALLQALHSISTSLENIAEILRDSVKK